jgi:2-phospho-L-lactate guanylyltransferase
MGERIQIGIARDFTPAIAIAAASVRIPRRATISGMDPAGALRLGPATRADATGSRDHSPAMLASAPRRRDGDAPGGLGADARADHSGGGPAVRTGTTSARERPRPEPGPVTVIIPVRSLEGAKSRLGAVLDAEERRELVERLLRRTVAAAIACRGVGAVAVVSPDPAALALAVDLGAERVRQDSRGLNRALSDARAAFPEAERLLVLPADLASVSPRAIEALISVADDAGPPCVVLVTDRDARGTNALLLDPPDVIEFAFGGDSREAHAALAAAAGARLVEPESPLVLDLDTPDDLLRAEGVAPESLGVP